MELFAVAELVKKCARRRKLSIEVTIGRRLSSIRRRTSSTYFVGIMILG